MSSNLLPGLSRLIFAAVTLSLTTACIGPNVEIYERPDGTIIVESLETKATVTAIDARARTVTLKRRFHKAQIFKADKGIINFNQIQVGDEVHAVVVEKLAVSLVPGGAPPLVKKGAAIGLAPEGDKPGIVLVATAAMTAEITAIDSHSRQVTLELPDGSIKTVKARKHIDLTQISLGDAVLIQITRAVAIEVVKPR